ncbi:MAG: hypothetical protein ACYTJ0_21260 [Planctomycetota bacterium]|jgi:hypothetical protein
MILTTGARRGALAAVLTVPATASCGPPDLTQYTSDVAPAEKVRRAAASAEDRDPESLRWIVEQLDSDDPVVRLTAITALERRTGETHGYRYDAPAREREPAVRRWVRFAREQSAPGPVAEGADADE